MGNEGIIGVFKSHIEPRETDYRRSNILASTTAVSGET